MGCTSCGGKTKNVPTSEPPLTVGSLSMPSFDSHNPVANIQLSKPDTILNFVRDRVIDRLVYDNGFDPHSAPWIVSHTVTTSLVEGFFADWRFPKVKDGEEVLNWLVDQSEGINDLVDLLVSKFCLFKSSLQKQSS